jgi:PAS domain S-box-containing protein
MLHQSSANWFERFHRRSLLSLLPPFVALILQLQLWPFLRPYGWFLFFPAILVSSWIGGLRSSVFATAASTALVFWFFVPPEHSFAGKAQHWVPASVFFFLGVVTGLVHERLIRAIRTALAESRAANVEISRLYEDARVAQDRFDLALRGAQIGAWDWNIETGEVSYSPSWYEIGLHDHEVRPQIESWRRRIHPDDWPRVDGVLTDYLEGKLPEYAVEYRARARSGEWIWILARGKVFVRDEMGRPTRMAGTAADITQKKALEDALRLSEARSSGIVAISADAIIAVDASQLITLFNEGAEKIFGYAREEAVGSPLDVLIPERFRDVHRQHLARFAAGPDQARLTRGVDIFGLRKNGEEFPAQASISKFEVGGTTLLTVTLRDITEEKRRENEQRFLADVGSMLVGTIDYSEVLTKIAEMAVSGLADLCIVDIVEDDGELRRVKVACRDPSKSWLVDRLMQIPLSRSGPYIAKSVVETLQPLLLRRPSPEEIASMAMSREHLEALRAADIQSLIAVPLLAHGRVLGAMVLVSSARSHVYDAADVRLAEEVALRSALSIENARLYRTAQVAIRARDEVLAVVAHDLRNPLGAILMQSSALRRRGSEPERRSQKPAEMIKHAATRMNHLIDDLLDVTRMEAGRFSIQQADLATGPLVAESIEAQRGLAEAAALDLRVDTAGYLPDVFADHDRLLQVLGNLVGNAIKFTQPGGIITVGAAPRGGEVLFWVADTGVGIAADKIPHVFERFWQAEKGERRGTGLGLPIVRGIVEAHGGRVWVESELARGSTFFFTMPAAPRAEPWRETSPG